MSTPNYQQNRFPKKVLLNSSKTQKHGNMYIAKIVTWQHFFCFSERRNISSYFWWYTCKFVSLQMWLQWIVVTYFYFLFQYNICVSSHLFIWMFENSFEPRSIKGRMWNWFLKQVSIIKSCVGNLSVFFSFLKWSPIVHIRSYFWEPQLP